VVEGSKGKKANVVDMFCEKLREKLPQITPNGNKPIEIRTPIKTTNGQIVVTVFKDKNGQIRRTLTLRPNGGHPLYNRLMIESVEHIEFLKEIAQNIKDIEKIANVVLEVEEEAEYMDILKELEVS